MMDLPDCPICGAKATTVHYWDTYDRADFGWSCGCPRFSLLDKVHPDKDFVLIARGATKEAAEAAWIKICDALEGER